MLLEYISSVLRWSCMARHIPVQDITASYNKAQFKFDTHMESFERFCEILTSST